MSRFMSSSLSRRTPTPSLGTDRNPTASHVHVLSSRHTISSRRFASFTVAAGPPRKRDGAVEEEERNPFAEGGAPGSSQQGSSARASSSSRKVPSPPGSPKRDEESRVEAMEKAIREGRKAPARQIPIRGVTPIAEKDPDSQYAPWGAWKLVPDGFDQMTPNQKFTELYMGRRGLLFWINKVAYGSAIGLLFAWVLFRIVFPNIGLYKLAGDLMPPSM